VPDQPLYDVVQIGYGPVSQVLALMLGRQGHKVAVVERWSEPYALPRAVCIDHEAARILQAIGLGDGLARVSRPAPLYQWFNADWEELLCLDWSREAVSGGPEVNFVHQPSLEAEFRLEVARQPNVELNLGWELADFTDHGDHVEVRLRELDGTATRTLRTRYLVGADGANSLVRETLGIGREDMGFQADWLVVDMKLNPGVTLDIPACGQYCNPERPTTMVPGGVQDGRICRRWEFMRLPGETREALADEAHVWELLTKWVRPDQAELVRHAIYTFRSLVADTWRSGRVLLVGDAAHTMPPFMGQGMCAGIRDAWNLSWKLDDVLHGLAGDALLDSYTTERKPHVMAVIDAAIHLGRIICIADPAEAAERDRSYKAGTAAPPPPFPHLTAGLLAHEADGIPAAMAGLLSPHGTVHWRGREGRWDAVVGLGFCVVVRDADPATILRADQLRDLEQLGTHVVSQARRDCRCRRQVSRLHGGARCGRHGHAAGLLPVRRCHHDRVAVRAGRPAHRDAGRPRISPGATRRRHRTAGRPPPAGCDRQLTEAAFENVLKEQVNADDGDLGPEIRVARGGVAVDRLRAGRYRPVHDRADVPGDPGRPAPELPGPRQHHRGAVDRLGDFGAVHGPAVGSGRPPQGDRRFAAGVLGADRRQRARDRCHGPDRRPCADGPGRRGVYADQHLGHHRRIDASKPTRHGLNIGIQQAMLPLFGLAIAPLLVTNLLQLMSWRWVFPLLTIPGLVVATLMILFLRNQVVSERVEATHNKAPFREVLRQRNIPILMVGMLAWLTCLIVTSAMFPSFLMDYLHLSLPQMGYVMSAIGFGAAAGCLVLPSISDRIGRKPVMVAGTIGACLSIYALSQTGADPARLFLFLFLTHFFNFALLTLTVGPLSVESVPPAYMATASGMVICVGELFGGGLAPILAGTVAQRFGIEHVLGLAMGGLVIGFVAMLFLKETAPDSWRRETVSTAALAPART